MIATGFLGVTCWGYDAYQQISGEPTTGTFTDVSVGYFAASAISSTGSTTCWGNNQKGQATDQPAEGTFTAVSVGYFAACAISSTGSITFMGGIGIFV